MSDRLAGAAELAHEVSIVIPVYQGETTLAALVAEIAPMTEVRTSPEGHAYRVIEVLAVYDNGPDDSARVLRELETEYAFFRAIWLSKNFGQHAATLAGMASSGGEWILTSDEDGQHDPSALPTMLDTAMREQCAVVYAKPTNPAPHGVLRNVSFKGAKWILPRLVSSPQALDYHSLRLILGSVGRGVAAYSGAGVYLDVDPKIFGRRQRIVGRSLLQQWQIAHRKKHSLVDCDIRLAVDYCHVVHG